MKTYIERLKKYSQVSYRVLLFIAAAVIISTLMPKESKFRYEYKKGEPWRYEILIAPFDFRIFKTQQEIQLEKDSILKKFRPYFVYDTAAVNLAKQEFKSVLKNKLPGYRQKYPFLKIKLNKPDSIQLIAQLVDTVLQQVYAKGVIAIPDEYADKKDELELMLVRGNLAEPFMANEFYTLRSAYKFIINELAKGLAFTTNDFEVVEDFISELPINDFLFTNINLDISRTASKKEAALKNLALTNGMVMAQQRVIEKGEIIDEAGIKKLDSYKKEYESRVGTLSQYNIRYAGQVLVTLMFMASLFLFLYFYRKDVYGKLKYITFLLLILCTIVVMAFISHRIPDVSIYIIPFTILPLIVRTFMDSRLGFFFSVIAVVMASFFAENSFEFVFLQIPACIAAIFSLYKMARRAQIVSSAIYIFLTYSVFFTGLHLMRDGDIKTIDYNYFIYFAINALFILVLYPLIYIFEKLFGFLSDVTLVELSDTNHPLLRKLAETAPGTFQHSIQVGNLAQEVAYKIDANPLLVRAGAMYHDIGKIANPLYFTENQISGINPHDNMEFEDSAKVVIDHIVGGVKIAHKHKLPQTIIDFISTHQGTTKTKYFYNSFANQYPDKDINEANFSYPGPTPFTKETAILMMADCIEAASRSLKEYSEDAIDKLVENIVNMQIEEGQFVNAPITFKEITQAKAVFKEKLKNIYHARVVYPTLNKKK